MGSDANDRLVAYVGAAEGYEAAAGVLTPVANVQHIAAEPSAVAAALVLAEGFLDASMKVHISESMLSAASRLRIISCATTGSDHISQGVADERGIVVRTLRENPNVLQNLTPAAELSWTLLMACARNLPAAVTHVQEGRWVREEFPGRMLKGSCLGLVGCGRIGVWMARYARAFDMEVIGHDPFVEPFPESIEPVALEAVFERADFISIHVHLTKQTEGLVSADLLARVRRGVVIINTSRGQLLDEAALLTGLNSGHIGAAGLDVLAGEPDVGDDPLVAYASSHDNLLITPHCGGFSPDAVRLVCRVAATKIRDVLEVSG